MHWRIPALVSVLALESCAKYEDCFAHCWDTTTVVADSDSNGYFDSTCANFYGGAMSVPLPAPSESYAARACATEWSHAAEQQADHDRVKEVIQAIADDTVGSLSIAQEESWDALRQSLADSAWNSCISHVTGYPGHQDINPGLAGSQACTNDSAATLCTTYVFDVLNAALDLSNGASTAVPDYSGADAAWAPVGECNFEPEGLTTGEAYLADDTGAFGNIAANVACSPQTSCTVDQALIWEITTSFSEFYAEGVQLKIGSSGSPCNVTGAKISGLGAGEDAKALADAFDFRNNDYIQTVEGIALSTSANALQVVNDLQSTTDPITITIKRKMPSGTCSTLNYTITLDGY